MPAKMKAPAKKKATSAKKKATSAMSSTTFSAPVAKLFSYGHASSRTKWPNYVEELGLRAEHVAELIDVVVRSDLSHVNSGFPVEESAAHHAWRALGQLRAVPAVTPLLEALLEEKNAEAFEASSEIPTVLASIGPEAIPAIEAFAARADVDWNFKLIALDVLTAFARSDSRFEAQVEAVGLGMLASHRENDPYFNSKLVSRLIGFDLREPSLILAVIEDETSDALEVDGAALARFIQKYNPAAHFMRRGWGANAEAFMTSAGAQVRVSGSSRLVFDWPVDQLDRSIEMEMRSEGTLLIVTMFAWMTPVAPATKELVDVLGTDLCGARGDGTTVDFDWQYSDDQSEPVVLSLSEVFEATDGAWMEASKAAVLRLARMFVELDPVVRAAIDGELDVRAARAAVRRIQLGSSEGDAR